MPSMELTVPPGTRIIAANLIYKGPGVVYFWSLFTNKLKCTFIPAGVNLKKTTQNKKIPHLDLYIYMWCDYLKSLCQLENP